jgi:hypothetical protein
MRLSQFANIARYCKCRENIERFGFYKPTELYLPAARIQRSDWDTLNRIRRSDWSIRFTNRIRRSDWAIQLRYNLRISGTYLLSPQHPFFRDSKPTVQTVPGKSNVKSVSIGTLRSERLDIAHQAQSTCNHAKTIEVIA